MVLLAELLIAVGILVGVYWLATRPDAVMSVVEPDRSPAERADGPLTADELVALRIPLGFGYRKVDVDRLLDRLARQLPRDGSATTTPVDESEPVPVSLAKEPDRG
jgi:hypothetical protein